MFDQTMIWWRPLPNPNFFVCTHSGTAQRPSVIMANSITVLDGPSFTLIDMEQSQYIVTIDLEWDPPLAPYGAEDYEVYLGGQPVDEDNQDPFILTVVSS